MKTLRELRLDIDPCINSIKLLSSSREVSLAHTSLQRSKMWLGQALKVSGEINPYPESDNPYSGVIEKHKTFDDERTGWAAVKDQTAKVKFFSVAIELLLMDMEKIRKQIISKTVCGGKDEEDKRWAILFFEQSHLALIEAKMWMGVELNSIREAVK